jgi:hypothetical protein
MPFEYSDIIISSLPFKMISLFGTSFGSNVLSLSLGITKETLLRNRYSLVLQHLYFHTFTETFLLRKNRSSLVFIL